MSTATAESSASHLCGTLFEFNLEAKDEISKSFRAIAGPNVSCEPSDDNYFLIYSPKDDDTSLAIFLEILENFIKTESEKDADLFEDYRLARIKGTYANPMINRPKEIATQTITDIGVSDEVVPSKKASTTIDNIVRLDQPFSDSRYKSNDVFLIEHEIITRTWTSKGGITKLRSKDHALGRIGTLSSCRLLHINPESVDVIIKGDHEEDIQKAMSKLRIVDKAATQSLPLIFSFPIMEGGLAPMLQMVPLKDLIRDCRVDTTLLSSESPLIGIYPNTLVVTMIQGGERVPVKRSGIQYSLKEQSVLWEELPYQSFGTQTGASQESIEATIPVADSDSLGNLATTTALWVRQAGQSHYLDPFQPDQSQPVQSQPVQSQPDQRTQGPATQEQPEGMAYRVPLELTPIPIKPSTKRSRAAKGASKAATTSVVKGPSLTLAASPTVIPTVLPVPAKIVTSLETRAEVQSCLETIPRNMAARSPTAAENQRLLDNLKTPAIESPYNAPSESASPVRSITPFGSMNSANWATNLVPRAKGGILIDVQLKNEDTVREKDFRGTMGQKKSQKGINGSSTELVRAFETAARQIFDLALLRQGPVKFEVGIGRLLVNPQTMSAEFKRPFAVAEWCSAFPIKNGVPGLARETIFTPRLTTYSPDADAILDIKMSRGQNLFLDKPCERKVTYIISCITKAKEQVMIEVSEDGSFEMKGSELLVGALDWHFPLRSWDSRLHITAQETLMGNYQQQAQGIVRSMKVTIDREGVKFSSITIDQELVIQSVLLRRGTAHPANNIHKDIVLHLEEMQDMSVQQISENEYHGLIRIPAKNTPVGKLWWEASLTSAKAAMILKESEEVEFGEMGKWSPKKIIDGGIIKDIYAVANEVVTRIDLVGRKNQGPKSNSGSKTSTKAKTSPKTSIPEGPPGMAPPPAKRQKRLVVLSSDDDREDGNAGPPRLRKHEVRKSVTRLTSSNGPAKQTLTTRSRAKPAESTVKRSRSSTATQTSPTLPDVSPKKSSRTSKASMRSHLSKPISTFFGAASQPQLMNRQETPQATSQEVENEAEDLIEDDSPTEEVNELIRSQHKTNSVLDRRKRPRDDNDSVPSGSQRFKLAGDATKNDADGPVSRKEIHLMPWAERFRPSNLEELMVHKKKVSDVQTWLDNVLQGRDRKRVLILMGPSGAGKTATVSTLAKAMGFELCEWRNPVGSEFSSESYLSMAAQFEEFLGRSGRFGGLQLSDSAGKTGDPSIPATKDQSTRRKVILIEEFPNTFLSTSSALRSFRSNVLEYLVVNTPSMGAMLSETLVGNITPLVMVVTETRLTTTTAASDSFTAHRLLGSDILSHPGVSVIEFNPMAATLLTKALDLVIQKEARQSGRRGIPGPSVTKQLGKVGDVRSAIGSLEFLCLRRGIGDDWGGRVASRTKKGASVSTTITKMERESLEMVTQRESSLGIFHAVGKVVYNKRDQVGAAQDTILHPPGHLSDHARSGVSQVSVDRLIDETGTDTGTFIAALHENYVLSCEGNSFINSVNGCLDALSDSDILGSPRGGRFGTGGEYGGRSFHGAASDSLRQDGICFQLAVRGLLFSLPDPVKRCAHPVAGKSGGKNDSYRMFYPTSMRLTRQMEEVDSLVDLWTDRLRSRCGVLEQRASDRSHQLEGVIPNRQNSAMNDAHHPDEPERIRTNLNCTKVELILERLPYITKIEHSTAPTRLSELAKITEFRGINVPSSEVSDEEDRNDLSPLVEWTTDCPAESKSQSSALPQVGIGQAGKDADTLLPLVEEEVEKLYLSDDDIED